MFDNENFRYGSAKLVTQNQLAKSDIYTAKRNAALIGFDEANRALYYSDMGGWLIIAGARSGKMRDILSYNICANEGLQNIVLLDPKGEGASIARGQNKASIYWNPNHMHGLPSHKINPLEYIHIESNTLVTNVKTLCQNILPQTNATKDPYFINFARRITEALCLSVTEQKGTLNFRDLYEAVLLLLRGDQSFFETIAFDMATSKFPSVIAMEKEITSSMKKPTNGYNGAIGELANAFESLSDPALMASLSPHPDGSYDFYISDFVTKTDQKHALYLMPEIEAIEGWKTVIKSIFVACFIYKSKNPSSAPIEMIIDEAPLLKGFPLLTQLFSVGAGIGLRPILVAQSIMQLDDIENNASDKIMASAKLQSFFAIRDNKTAEMISQKIGTETLIYSDKRKQNEARYNKEQILKSMFFDGADMFDTAIDYAHAREENLTEKQQRQIRTMDEVLNMPENRQFIFYSNKFEGAIYAKRLPYYEQEFMAGKFYLNPFYPPSDKVKVKTARGYKWLKIKEVPTPYHLAHLPQYQNHPYSILVDERD